MLLTRGCHTSYIAEVGTIGSRTRGEKKSQSRKVSGFYKRKGCINESQFLTENRIKAMRKPARKINVEARWELPKKLDSL